MHRFVTLVVLLVTGATELAAQNLGGPPPEFDSSGKGAVLCAWEIFVGVRNAIDLCFPGEFQALRADLSEAIDATNKFIVANSPGQVTKAGLEASITNRADRDRATLARFSGPASESLYCRTARNDFIEPMATGSREDFRRGLADFLSVPRKPVMNPCL
jgi:hypothetical protein